jgi:hypothetical protein
MGQVFVASREVVFRSAIGLVLLALPGSLRADTIEYLTYNVTLNSGLGGISDIVFLNQLASGIGSTRNYSLPPGSGTVTEIWPTQIGSINVPPINTTMGFGLASGVPGDSGPTLAVLGGYTTGEVGESFSALFPDANEGNLILDLENLGGVGCLLDPTCPVNVASDVVPFFNDAKADGLFIAPGANFDVVAYTNGQLVGTGSLVQTTTTTPEPSSLFLLGACLLSIGLMALTRRGNRLANRV